LVRIKLYRARDDGRIYGFHAHGHSGFATSGEDIVCAAVSVLTTVTVLGLQARLGLDPHVAVDEEAGSLDCRLDLDALDATMSQRTQDLLETMALGLRDIAEQHPNHVSVEEVTR